MTVPAYATDLTNIVDCDSNITYYEFTGMSQGGVGSQETDYFIQGTTSTSATTTKTGLASIAHNYGSPITISSGNVVLFWQWFGAPNAINDFANGGQRCVIGTSLTVWNAWKSGGNDYSPMPYGGWKNVAIDPTVTPDYPTGTVTTYNYFGIAVNLTAAIAKGNPFAMDCLRYGRAEIRATYGESANYATFAGMAAKNDSNTTGNYNRWGLFQATGGTYLWKGLMSLGLSGTLVDFRDSNRVIFIDDTPRVASTFNKIEINNASSRVDWTNISFTALGTTSPGAFEMVASADVNIESCRFKGMNTFIFTSTGDALNTTFESCGQITMPGGKLNGSSVLTSTVDADAYAVVWDVDVNPDGFLDGMTFSKGTNAHHAIAFGTTSPTSITLNDWTTTGFNASNGENDSTFYVARDSGAVTISVVRGSGNFTYKSAGATVSIVIDPVTTRINVQTAAGVAIDGARVIVEAGDDTGDLPFEESVTITRSSSTASVSHTGHGLSNGDKVCIRGAVQQAYNGVFTISNVSTNAYDYTVVGTPDTPATGTITSTGVVVAGTTSSGYISASRTFTEPQNIRGSVRKTSAAPFYITQDFVDVVDNVNGLTKTIQLSLDQ